MKLSQLPKPIIFTKETRKGISRVIQFILEASLVAFVFTAGLIATIKMFGVPWVLVYGLLFFFTCMFIVAYGYY